MTAERRTAVQISDWTFTDDIENATATDLYGALQSNFAVVSVPALWHPGSDSRIEVGCRCLNNGAASTEEYFRMSHQWNVGIGALLLSEFAGSFQSQQAAAAALSARYEKVLSLATRGVGSCQVMVAPMKFQPKQIRIVPDIAQTSATADVGRTDPRFPDGMLIQHSFPLPDPLSSRRCGYTESHPNV